MQFRNPGTILDCPLGSGIFLFLWVIRPPRRMREVGVAFPNRSRRGLLSRAEFPSNDFRGRKRLGGI
jgi:hypothetical protein